MLHKRHYKIIEMTLLFVALPVTLVLDIPLMFKLIMLSIGIGYCIWIAIKLNLITAKSLYQIDLKGHIIRIGLSYVIIAAASFIFMRFSHPEDFFIVVKSSPLLWLGIIFFYAIFSVYPQELLYRGYFFNRYQGIFKNTKYLLLINVLVFPLAHLFFDNWLVLLVTLIGGVFFTVTYHKSKSVMLTSIEHAIYGNWLFTIGMGEMLAFPMPR